MVVENVRGAQKWVGPAVANFGSFYFWGDFPVAQPDLFGVGPRQPVTFGRTQMGGKNNGGSWFNIGGPGQTVTNQNPVLGFKSSGMNWSDQTKRGQDFTRIAGKQAMDGVKQGGTGAAWFDKALDERRRNPGSVKVSGDWFGSYAEMKEAGTISPRRRHGTGSKKRAFASAMIAKIPEPIAQFVGRSFWPADAGR